MNKSQAHQNRGRFHYITAAYRCPRCSRIAERAGITLSAFYALVAFVAAIPAGIILLGPPWSMSWYSMPGILAGEFLLLYAAGFLLSLLYIVIEPGVCRGCKAPMQMTGRYFSHSPRPRATDLVLLGFFVAMNAGFLLFLWPSQLFAAEAESDILMIALKRPLNTTVQGVPAKYGDPNLAAAVDALGDIPRPWTVPKIIEVFKAESATWQGRLQAQIDQKNHQMWEDSDRERERCGHLATLLAASRDPRAAVVLGEALERHGPFPGAIQIIEGLDYYFLHDPRYHQVPLFSGASLSLLHEKTQDVKRWWEANKEELKSSTKAQ